MLLQIVCTGSAIAALPPGLIHPGWLATFIVPSILFLSLGFPTARRFVPTWLRVVLSAGFQGSAAWIAFIYFGPLDEKSTLACSLLPALTYFTLRREPSDTSLSLFLSFCFLLIGIMLNNDAADWTLLVFLVSCPWAMQIESTNRSLSRRHSTRGKTMPVGTRALRRTQVIIAMTMVALCTYFVVGLIPSPGEERRKRANNRNSGSHHNRNVGLNNRFNLTGGQGSPLNVSTDEVLNVRDPLGGQVPDNLYLRMMFFDRPGIGEWRTWPFTSIRRQQDPGKPFWCKEAFRRDRGARKHLVIQRKTPSPRGELYLPPGTIGIQGVRNLEFNNIVGHYRSAGPVEGSYRISYQQMRTYASRSSVKRNTALLNRLDDLPDSLRSDELVALAHEFGGPRPQEILPMQLAKRIARALQRRCKYELRDPQGPYNDPIHNFLFGSRTGYCMHFATALAIMLRIHHVPCRIGVGFQGGTANSDKSRTFGSQHAHAWVEIPLVTFDWVIVDPTPGTSLGRRGWPDPNAENAVTVASDNAAKDGDPATGLSLLLSNPLASLRDPMRHLGPLLFLLVVFTLVTVSLITVVKRGSHSPKENRGVNKPTPDALRARQLLDKILAVLSRNGHPKKSHATLEQYSGLLEHRQIDADLPALRLAFDSYQQVRFGQKSLTNERQGSLLAGLETARTLSN
ncbi:MAG: transglutaminase domain-containing protein [Planctomycetota bacterium]|nr:transglutaminase domain-containing protein [Planctomycetota bacterium]